MSIDTLSEIVALLEGTILATSKAIELPIPQSQSTAFAIEVDADNACAAWDLMRSKIDITGRYPVIVSDYSSSPPDWEESMWDMNLFGRWSYGEEASKEEGIAPQQIVERSKSFDVDGYLAAEDDEFFLWQFDEEEIEDILMCSVEKLEERYGKAPKVEEILDALGLANRKLGVDISGEDIHEVKLERWLFEWELANVDDDRATTYQGKIYDRDWFGSGNYDYKINYALILVPTPHGWETLAYIHWYGSFCVGSDGAIAFLKRWYDNYQAELVCHFNTVLHLNVGRRPSTPQEAFDLSVEQFTLSDYGIQHDLGISDYALYLMQVDYWYFHKRP
jgi:hypothetical protein